MSKVFGAVQRDTFPDKRQTLLLMNVLRNTVTTPGMQLPLVHTTFLVHCASIVRKPDHALYTAVNNFLLARPALNLGRVPMFLDTFLQTDPRKIAAHRIWELQILHTAITSSSASEYRIWKKSSALETLFAEHDNPTCDRVSGSLVEDIAERILSRWPPASSSTASLNPGYVNCLMMVLRWLTRAQRQKDEGDRCSDSYAEAVVSLTNRNSAVVQVLSSALLEAGSLMIQCGRVAHGLTVLKAVSDVIPAVFQPPQFVKMLEDVLSNFIDTNNVPMAKLTVEIICSLVPPEQDKPPMLDSLLHRVEEELHDDESLSETINGWITPNSL